MDSFNIIKRNGQRQLYDFNKIERSVRSAFETLPSHADDEEKSIQLILRIIKNSVEILFAKYNEATVEHIQDAVEQAIFACGQFEVGKEYILYREKHNESRFIKDRIDYMQQYSNSTDNAATSSETDANANVTMKNVANLEGEVYKTTNRIIQRQRMKEELNSLYPEVAKQYGKDLDNHIIYTHDEASTPVLKQYTYSPKESIVAKVNDHIILCTFEELYDMCTEDVNEVESGVYVKKPKDFFVKDRETWTPITFLTKKKRHRDLVRVKLMSGEDVIVTDNHPLIINGAEDTIEASEAISANQFRYYFNSLKFENQTRLNLSSIIPYYDRELVVNKQLGYILGSFIGSGHYDSSKDTIIFTQDKYNNLDTISEYLKTIGIESKIVHLESDKNVLIVRSELLYDIFTLVFLVKPNNINIPQNVFSFNKNFASGIISGIKDSCSKGKDSCILKSRCVATKFSILLNCLGYNCDISSSDYKEYLFQISSPKRKSNKWTQVVEIDNIIDEKLLDSYRFIYDITTASHTLICNNIWMHNCMAVSLYPLLTEGVGNIDGITPGPPNDLQSFSGQITNLVFLLSSQCKGAVACLHGSQKLLINGSNVKIKDFVNEHWDNPIEGTDGFTYCDVSDKNLNVYEDGKYVKILKVYKKPYNNKICTVTSKSGFTAKVSEDHLFKTIVNGEIIAKPAKFLHKNDLTFVNANFKPYSEDNWKEGFDYGLSVGNSVNSKALKEVIIFDKSKFDHSTHDYNIGFLDGYIVSLCKEYHYYTMFTVDDKQVFDVIKSILNSIYVKYIVKEENNEFVFYVKTNQLIKYCKNVLFYIKPFERKLEKTMKLNKDFYDKMNYATDEIKSVKREKNDDDFVYEIETDSHWYNCGGFITHNCSEYFVALNYYVTLEYGQDWYNRLNEVCTNSNCFQQRTIKDNILKAFKQFVWGINQPAGNRSYQSP